MTKHILVAILEGFNQWQEICQDVMFVKLSFRKKDSFPPLSSFTPSLCLILNFATL